MLRPPAPDSSEKNTSFGINRRLFLSSAILSASSAIGYAIYRQLQSSETVSTEETYDDVASELNKEKEMAKQTPVSLESLEHGESLFNRALSIVVRDDEQREFVVEFLILRDDKGICIKIGDKQYRSMNSFINKSIDTAITRKEEMQNGILLETKYYGTASIPPREVKHLVLELSKGHDVTDIVVDASYKTGILTSALPTSLFQKKKHGDQSGYSITFIRDGVPADQIAQLQF